jgi:hypothetical protein
MLVKVDSYVIQTDDIQRMSQEYFSEDSPVTMIYFKRTESSIMIDLPLDEVVTIINKNYSLTELNLHKLIHNS